VLSRPIQPDPSILLIVALALLPLMAASVTYFLNVSIVFGIVLMCLISVLAVALYRRSMGVASTTGWVVDSAFEICAVIGLVASITAAIPIFETDALQRQRQAVVDQMRTVQDARGACVGAVQPGCCLEPGVLNNIEAFRAAGQGGSFESDRPQDWKAFRDRLQESTQSCHSSDGAMIGLVRLVNAYTKSISDHQSYGAVRSSLSWLNDIKVSVLFTVSVIFYLCQAISLKLMKSIWIGRPE
jgi:hypothetical protein